MNRNRKTTKRYLFWAGGSLLVALFVICFVDDFFMHLYVAFAEDQTAIFEQMRRQVKDSDAAAVGCLEYVVSYYASGTKQDVGTPLDLVVERARQAAIREIIGILRTKTGQDFGEDSHLWIEGLKDANKH